MHREGGGRTDLWDSRRLRLAALLEVVDHLQPAAMSIGLRELRSKERRDQLTGQRRTHHPSPETQHVEVVVLDSLVRRECVVTQRRPNAAELVGGDARTHAASAKQ